MSKEHPRAKGDGSASKRADGTWRGDVDFGTRPDGRRDRKTVYGKTKADVLQKMRPLLEQRDAGLSSTAGTQSVRQYLTDWLAYLDTHVRPDQPRTYTSYEATVRLHIIPVIGEIKLARLTPDDVERMVGVAMKAGHRRTAIYARTVLRIALNRALKRGFLMRNVAALADVPADVPITPRRALTLDEARKVRDAAGRHRLHALWVLALATGMREAELLGLEWRDVDLARGEVTVRQQLQRIDGELIARPLKTNASAARVVLPPFVVDALRAHRLRTGERSGYVFLTRTKRPIDPRSFQRQWGTVLTWAKVPYVPFHATRHTCATLLYAEGVPDKIIQSVLRHARLSTTLDVYTHLGDDAQESARAAMERMFGAQ